VKVIDRSLSELLFFSSASSTLPSSTRCTNTPFNGLFAYSCFQCKIVLPLSSCRKGWTPWTTTLPILFMKTCAEVCSKSTNCSSLLFWPSRLGRATIRSMIDNGDTCSLGLLEKSPFRPIPPLGFLITSGLISTDNSMELANLSTSRTSTNISWKIPTNGGKYSIAAVLKKNNCPPPTTTNSIFSRKS